MNQMTRKVTALGLCAALCLGGAGAAVAQNAAKSASATAAQPLSTDVTKDETVYVLANADGSVEKIIVSDWIRNTAGSDTVVDRSELTDIENVKGDETYTLDADNTIVWDARGNDIYYQGTGNRELPVALNVSYKLDGEAVSAETLAGKSGRVTIRFDYENRQCETVTVDGKEETFYVPFAMLTGVLLDDENFRNVEVSNGKLINDGDRTAVVGLAFPGLQEDLGIDRETFEIPNFVEITADVTDFSLGMTVTLATNELFSEIDVEKLDLADAESALGELTDAMKQLTDGSSALYDGLCTLLEKSDELVAGVKTLAAGAQSLKNGADTLSGGADSLQSGADSLSVGLDAISAKSAELNGGAAQVFDSLLSAATTQLRAAGISVADLSVGNYADVLDGVIASLDESAVYAQASAEVTAAVEAERPSITEKVTAAVREQVTQQVTAAVRAEVRAEVNAAVTAQVTQQVLQSMGMTAESYAEAVAAGAISEEQQAQIDAAVAEQLALMQDAIDAAVEEKMASDEVQATVAANVEAQMQTDAVRDTIAQAVEAQVQQAIADNMNSEAVQAKLAAASEGSKTVIALKTSLDSYRAFYLGVLSYTDAVDKAADGATALSEGANKLKSGAAEVKSGAAALYSGVLTLQNGMPALVEGITTLRDGAMTLSDGLAQLDEQGIQKLVTLLDGDLASTLTRLKATVAVSQAYTAYSAENTLPGQVKFIYRTEEIEQAD